MLFNSFDPDSRELINPRDFLKKADVSCDTCVMTFSHAVIEHALENLPCEHVANLGSVNGIIPVYMTRYNGKNIAFFMSFIGSTGAGTCMEDVNFILGATRFIMFGSCGALQRSITEGKLIVPTKAYRDEGFSYHYAPAADYIEIKNAGFVAKAFDAIGVPYVTGGTWTTDAIYRETAANAAKRRAEGCVAVEMECAGAQAVCDFRGWEYFDFLFAGDLLDSESWDLRTLGSSAEIDHQLRYFMLALELAVRE